MAGTNFPFGTGTGIGRNWVKKGSGIGNSPEFCGIPLGIRNQAVATSCDRVIGDLLAHQMLLLLIAIDPLGRLGPLLDHFLFGSHMPPRFPSQSQNSKPNVTLMYSKLSNTQAQKESSALLTTTGPRCQHADFMIIHTDSYYLTPMPSISTIQKLGLSITKAFVLHIRCASRKFIDHPAHTLPSRVFNHSYPGQ